MLLQEKLMLLWAMALLDLFLLDLQDQSHNLLDRHLEHKKNLILDLDCELALNQALKLVHRLALALQRVVLYLNIDLRDQLKLELECIL